MKIAIITVRLVPEADDKPNEDIEEEILQKLVGPPRLPWAMKIVEVKVLGPVPEKARELEL